MKQDHTKVRTALYEHVNMHGRLKSLDLLVVSPYQHTTKITGSSDGV